METNPMIEMGTNNEETVDLRRLFGLLKRNLWLILLGMLLAGGAAFGVSLMQTPIYEAKTQVMVTRSSSTGAVADITQALNAQQLSQTYVELLSQDWVLEDVGAIVDGEVTEDQVNISAATNTLVINIVVEDPDPARAARIADGLVQVLISQNDAIQSTRYTDAEQGLNLQIQQIQAQLADTQVQLDLARTGALSDKIAQIQEKIQATQTSMEAARTELAKLNTLTTPRAQAMLDSSQANLQTAQALLDSQLAEYQALSDQLATDPLVQQDPQFAALLQSQMAEKGVAINTTREEIAALELEITWLSPLAEPGALEKARTERQEFITLHETLLASYQQTYTDLLVSGDVEVSTDRVAQLEKDLSLYQQIYLNMLNSREAVRLQKMQNMPSVIQVKPALAGEEPVRPRILLNTILGGMAGLILAVSIILLADFLDTTLKTREDVERILNVPVIGYVMQLDKTENEKDGPYVVRVPRSPAAESFRSLRTNLEFVGVDQPLKSILISSPGSSEGKTTVAANLAAIMAQSGKRVILVDADLRRPRLHREMGLVNRLGLSDIFRDKVALGSVYQPWDNLSLSVVTSGGIPPNPAELLGSEKMRQILDQLESEFDIVILDSTPTLVTDSQLIAARVDGVLLVLWPGRTHAEAARAAVEQYRRVGARLLGVVLNNIQPGQAYGGYTPYLNYQYYQYEHNEPRPGLNGAFKFPSWRRAPRGAGKEQKEHDGQGGQSG